MLISIDLYMFNVVCAARLTWQYAEFPSLASDAVRCACI